MARLDEINVLLIDANANARTQLRRTLESLQVPSVDEVWSGPQAMRRLRAKRYDLVLCEYDLGDQQDGQHLLEDLRNHGIIPLDTVFIMITGERNFERVVGTAELAPNDYILKPITPGTLQQRLQRAFDKRGAFLPAYTLIAAGERQEALAYCSEATNVYPRYRLDFLRLRALLHNQLHEAEQAEAVYRDILATKPVPWAEFGLAKSLVARQQFDEAEAGLQRLVDEHPYYLDAYDLLAQVREQLGRLDDAHHVLSNAVARSPHRLGRLRHYARTAFKVGDYETAEHSLSEVVRKSKLSEIHDPEDHLRLVQAQLAQNRIDDAQATIDDLDTLTAQAPAAAVCSAFSRALLHQHQGDDAAARQAVLDALAAGADMAPLSTEVKQALAVACLDHQLETEGSELVMHILRHAGDERTLNTTRDALRHHGHEALSATLEERLYAEVRFYVERGATKAHQGDYDGAVLEMMNAARKMPGNPHVLFNAALALLRHIEHKGWNARLATQAGTLITRTRGINPAHPKLDTLTAFMHSLMHHYGIRPAPPPVPER